MKRLLGDKEGSMDVEAILQSLDRLTQYEHLNAAAQTLGVVSGEQTHSACNLSTERASLDVREGLSTLSW